MLTKQFITKSFLALACLGTMASCKKTLDINRSVNNPGVEDATMETLFPSATMSTVGRVGGELAVLGGVWGQYYTQSASASQYRSMDAYNLGKADLNGDWNELYSGALTDYNLTIQKATAAGDNNYLLMATVLRAYTYQVLADLYDQVPYTDAIKGTDGNLQPAFQDGKTVYTGLLAELDAALAKDFSKPMNDAQKKTDFVFGGDITRWKAFANTLKLKMYMRMIKNYPADAEKGIRALYSSNAPLLTVNGGVNNFTDVQDGSNPLYEYNVRRLNASTNLRASITFLSWLKANNDPRIPYYYQFPSGKVTTYYGIDQGNNNATASQQPTYANAAVSKLSALDPVWLISAAESYFMQAEVDERYFGGTKAAGLYQKGLEAAFAQYGLDASKIPASYAYPSTGSFNDKLYAIIMQKRASFPASHSLEGFFEQNRTGIPAISPVYSTDPKYVPGQLVFSATAVTAAGQFPRRLVFPNSSSQRNINTPAVVPIYTPVWWAK